MKMFETLRFNADALRTVLRRCELLAPQFSEFREPPTRTGFRFQRGAADFIAQNA
ncbi:MAG: hypothetical protein IKW13_06375 [Thermoguttaceae bacterium]|nr:hypothetical protein [Thermoguttaceae bacterium]